jgi:predicted GNAT family acetyltransferase
MGHLLDRPIWSALTSRHTQLAEGGDLARRYLPAASPFIATRDDGPEALAAFAALIGPDTSQVLLQADPIVLPEGIATEVAAAGVQMVTERLAPAIPDGRIEPLTRADAQEMLDLASLTKPGPFTLRAQDLGDFWGIRIDGRLAVMAGERLKQDGWSELSGVATHPDYRGRGLARRLSLHVAHHIAARGERPYLHAYASNAVAISLYESMGFVLRTPMNVAVVKRSQPRSPG